VNAFALLAERKIANSTKIFKRAGIAFIPFLFKASMKFLNAVSFDLLVYLSKDMGLINCCECLTAAWKAFILANGKGMGTNDWVIRSLD
jgi:hypothetical protein